ncbi:MAG: helix-turn-helix transcriptional regulator [Clostridiales bacterium]|nr:helix-turn-helix transcriptional regulator [Clostridiales bacterium]
MQLNKITATEITGIMPIKKLRGWVFDKHCRDRDGLVLSDGCRHIYTQNGEEFVSSPQSVIFLPRGTTYYAECFADGFDYLIDFNSAGIGDRLFTMQTNESAEMIAELQRVITPLETDSVRYMQLSLFYTILARLSGSKRQLTADQRLIEPSLEYIRVSYTKPGLTLSELAAPSKISVAYFRQLFCEIYGVPPMKYVAGLRIAYAKQLLACGGLNISEIAAACGWSSVYRFSAHFKSVVGVSPSKYLHHIAEI